MHSTKSRGTDDIDLYISNSDNLIMPTQLTEMINSSLHVRAGTIKWFCLQTCT